MKRTHFTCTAPGCDRKHKAKGLCKMHYQRGGLDLRPRLRTPVTPEIVEAIRIAAPGRSLNQIAAVVGVSRPSVTKVRSQYNLGPSTYVSPVRLPTAPVPSWVPRDLRNEYVSKARLYGEFGAARWAREAKKATQAEIHP